MRCDKNFEEAYARNVRFSGIYCARLAVFRELYFTARGINFFYFSLLYMTITPSILLSHKMIHPRS